MIKLIFPLLLLFINHVCAELVNTYAGYLSINFRGDGLPALYGMIAKGLIHILFEK
jgi:hypothetical protein